METRVAGGGGGDAYLFYSGNTKQTKKGWWVSRGTELHLADLFIYLFIYYLFCVWNPIEDFNHTETDEDREGSNEPSKEKDGYEKFYCNLDTQNAV
jgi:hypothetical protein